MNERAVVLGIGSNLGGRRSLLRASAAAIAARLGAQEFRSSPIWQTEPLGPAQPAYLNAAISLLTRASLDEVLAQARAVEALLGRVRRERWGPRTVDLDILWHDGPAVRVDGLQVPHRELSRRAFALTPLLSLHPDARDAEGALLSSNPIAAQSPGTIVADSVHAPFATEVLSHTADEGFEVVALDRADLLAAAAEALGAIIVDPVSVRAEEARELRLVFEPDDDDEARLVSFLAEALHTLDAGRYALARAAVLEDGDVLRAVLLGEALDESRHAVRTAVKAITWHELFVRGDPDGYRARVIVDL